MCNFDRILVFVLIGVSLFFIDACAQESGGRRTEFFSDRYDNFPYDLKNPDQKFNLNSHLNEISALTYYRKNRLLCVNDEKGVIFQYNLKKREISHKYKFSKAGDYEGVELVGDTVFVLRSDGKIYSFKNWKSNDQELDVFKTVLRSPNDCEGLGYDASSNSLLVACKGRAGIDKRYRGKRTVYGFSLQSHSLDTVPRYIVDLEVLKQIFNLSDYARFSLKMLETVAPSKGDVSFQPSAVAIHPQTGNIYLLASVGKLLLILNPNGDIMAALKLDRHLFRQPEGICFAPDGTLFISNEGRGGKATILKFENRNLNR